MSDVVSLAYPKPEIALVTMQEKAFKNTFSPALIAGLENTFASINNNPQVKVVVIQGYDAYFCCGGTKEELLKIFNKEITFADLSFYRLLLDCKVPTIAAIQGHAMGGGLAFACYADMMVLAEEAFYTTNFMKYGFTPGMGATYIVPYKFGHVLGNELLYTAENYQGRELKQRGMPATIVSKAEVVNVAMKYANSLAEKTQLALQLLKHNQTEHMKQALAQTVQKELAMHEKTFAQPEVKARIEQLFGR